MTAKPNLFQLIDLDRTLFNTALLVKHITEAVDDFEPGLGNELEQKFEAAYQNEQTFFVMRYLRQRFGDAWFESLVDSIVTKHGREAYLMPWFHERLERAALLSSARPAWGILTFGDEIDQKMKLAIAGIAEARLYIADTPDKGVLIASWQQADGKYLLPKELTDTRAELLSFEDDKLRAFKGLPNDVIGSWLTPTSNAVAAQSLKEIGAGMRVAAVATLERSAAHIEQQLKNL